METVGRRWRWSGPLLGESLGWSADLPGVGRGAMRRRRTTTTTKRWRWRTPKLHLLEVGQQVSRGGENGVSPRCQVRLYCLLFWQTPRHDPPQSSSAPPAAPHPGPRHRRRTAYPLRSPAHSGQSELSPMMRLLRFHPHHHLRLPSVWE